MTERPFNTSQTAPAIGTAPEPEPEQAGQICDAILADAYRHGASAIHLTPYRGGLKLHLRIDGSLHSKPRFHERLPDGLGPEIISCMLNRADPDIVSGEIALPRSIEFSRSIEGSQLALRLSVLPTVYGPKLVISMPQDREALVLEVSARTQLEELLQGDGLIVVAAKRRTGRDQTFRALLSGAETNGRSVIAIERNSSPDLDNVVQLQLNTAAGLTHAAATAALEHQDADTILLSELRDPATAFGAFEAAHDGALVIAGINVTTALDATCELLAMGLEPWPLRSTLKAIVEQTAVRTLCPHCDGGCDFCDQTGWTGRTVLSGVVFIEGRLAELIGQGGSPEQLTRAISESGPGSLAHAAQAAVDAGVTTSAEVAHLIAGG
jgi:type II secretory ATPase GspE/PulE/Tfp pilus assembly ATPase PilB-like protein